MTLYESNQQLVKEWDYEKNGSLTPEMVTAHSNKKVWWKCDKGHSWQAYINNRSKGYGCPYCTNQRVLVGYNDLFSLKPELKDEWDFDKNTDVIPYSVTANNSSKVWWKCRKGHSWQAAIKDRNSGNGCPYCSNKKVLSGYNDIITTNPQLANEWDYEKNGSLTPEMVTAGSRKKVWWKCDKGHSWQAITYDRGSSGCPFCTNKKILVGFNDLSATNPQLAKEWDYEKNGSLTPEMVTAHSNKKVWWKCDKGHSWQATIYKRIRGQGCPYCSNRRIFGGFNDLATTNPQLASEWDYEKNGSLTPEMVTAGSDKKVWWNCHSCGYSWAATIASRNAGNGCPNCFRRNQTSYPEQAVFYYISKIYKDAINGYRDSGLVKLNMEIDIYIPCIKTGIEYDGKAWHNTDSSYEREVKKYLFCKDNEIKLIRIKEGKNERDKTTCDNVIYTSYKPKDSELNETINQLIHLLGFDFDIDIIRDDNEIRQLYYSNLNKNSLMSMNSEIVKEWDYEKNGRITPEMVRYGSEDRFWWKCSKGHSYRTRLTIKSQ